MHHNSDFRYDLKVGNEGENLLAQLLKGKRIEVKSDFGWHRTGNFYIEYQSRGKPSGIATSEAEWWALIGTNKGVAMADVTANGMRPEYVGVIFLLPKKRLIAICRSPQIRNGVQGGDNNTSIGCLVPSTTLAQYSN